MAAVTVQPHSSFLVNLPGPCEHKANLGCMLTALPCCCSCADRRPQATAYAVYIDGQGMRMKGRRWQRYCRKCYDHWQSLVTEPEPSTISGSLTTASPAVTVQGQSSSQPDSAMPPIRRGARTEVVQNRHEPVPVRVGHPRDSSFDANWSLNNLQPTPDTSAAQRRYNYHNMHSAPHADHQEAPHGHPPSQQAFPLGTREEAQQDDYSSPIGDMFNRAWARYRDVQDAREQYRQAESDVSAGMTSALQSISISGTEVRPEHGHLVDTRWINPDSPLRQNPFLQQSEPTPSTSSIPRPRGGRNNFHRQLYMSNPFDGIPQDRRNYSRNFPESDPRDGRSVIDKQTRPEPTPELDLKVDFGCKVCKEQKIDTVCLPCMHACMCHWCADIWKTACRTESGRLDKNLWSCPSCRKNITESRRFYI